MTRWTVSGLLFITSSSVLFQVTAVWRRVQASLWVIHHLHTPQSHPQSRVPEHFEKKLVGSLSSILLFWTQKPAGSGFGGPPFSFGLQISPGCVIFSQRRVGMLPCISVLVKVIVPSWESNSSSVGAVPEIDVWWRNIFSKSDNNPISVGIGPTAPSL